MTLDSPHLGANSNHSFVETGFGFVLGVLFELFAGLGLYEALEKRKR
jgi:hypothetical protein